MTRPISQIAESIEETLKEVVGSQGKNPQTEDDNPTRLIKSPLRYPGGKTRAIKKILEYFPSDIDRVCSPFLGGGSIELALACRGVEVFSYDDFKPLADFWSVLLSSPKKLSERVSKYYPLTKSKFYSLQREYWKVKSVKERATIFYVLNRASFSGTTLSGGMSINHPRFTKQGIEQLAEFKIDNFHFEQMDFQDSLKKHKKDFLYLDPPYANGEKLYGEKGSMHEYFDHEALAKILTKRDGWILSYNDHPKVKKLYKGYTMFVPEWAYGMNTSKKSSELLIVSKDFVATP